jgi:hypothetical protein
MDEKIVQEMLQELFSSLETLDAQGAAVLQLVRNKGLATEEEIDKSLKQAGDASSVRWLGVRVRVEHLLAAAAKKTDEDAGKKPEKQPEISREEKQSDETKSKKTQEQQQAQGKDRQQAPSERKEGGALPEASDKQAETPPKQEEKKESEEISASGENSGEKKEKQAA